MTPSQIVESFCEELDEIRKSEIQRQIEEAIENAVLIEREDCAKLAENFIGTSTFAQAVSNASKTAGESAIRLLRFESSGIAAQIRARYNPTLWEEVPHA